MAPSKAVQPYLTSQSLLPYLCLLEWRSHPKSHPEDHDFTQLWLDCLSYRSFWNARVLCSDLTWNLLKGTVNWKVGRFASGRTKSLWQVKHGDHQEWDFHTGASLVLLADRVTVHTVLLLANVATHKGRSQKKKLKCITCIWSVHIMLKRGKF